MREVAVRIVLVLQVTLWEERLMAAVTLGLLAAYTAVLLFVVYPMWG